FTSISFSESSFFSKERTSKPRPSQTVSDTCATLTARSSRLPLCPCRVNHHSVSGQRGKPIVVSPQCQRHRDTVTPHEATRNRPRISLTIACRTEAGPGVDFFGNRSSDRLRYPTLPS